MASRKGAAPPPVSTRRGAVSHAARRCAPPRSTSESEGADNSVSLRGPEDEDPKEELVAMYLKWPKSVDTYVRHTAESQKKTMTAVVVDAVRLDKDLAALLGGDQDALKTYARRHGLSLNKDLAVIVAKLLRRGLKASGSNDE